MDIRNYIPKDISALEPPDEQQDQPEMAMMIHFASPPAVSGSPSNCFICNRPVAMSPQQPDYYRPCLCNKDVAHVNCAMKEEFWKKNACVLCYKPLVAPQPPTKPPRKGILKRTDTLRCALCNNTRYQDEKTIKYDARFIRPCFCDVLTHHGCMSEVVRNSSNCNVCGVEYKVYKYGSLWDFFKRYFWQYTLLSLLVCSILVVSFICFIKPLKVRTITLVHVLQLIVSGILFLMAILLVTACVHHTLRVRLPRFRVRFAQVNVIDYEPSSSPGQKRSPMGRKPAGANRDEPRRHPEAIELARAAEEEGIDHFDAEGGHRTMPQDDVSRKCSQAKQHPYAMRPK
ncbi:hypothetical protein WR25_06041 isoform A [Diploscapter pachys]|uniref:Uncharacterized protein n=1 Tax=Diploscapter pachys TaxID=2018661 RepID=A0A2A2LQG7_9BILA|nr:hypothetical protein WR25_06041 isoform A [Diploscapter pachys]